MSRPNILFILTDQQSQATMGAYGGKYCRTPNLDALAMQSTVFQNAYTTCPVCSPARASIQTGLYPFQHGMQSNIFMSGSVTHELADRPHLLSRRLQSTGYECGYTGKWHLGYGREAYNDPYYNDRVFEIDRYRDAVDYPPEYRLASGLPKDIGYRGDSVPGHGAGGQHYPEYAEYLKNIGKRRTTRSEGELGEVITSGEDTTTEYFLVERSKEIIAEMAETGKPWFHTMALWGPHEPFCPPEEYFNEYKDLEIPPWPSFFEDQSNKPLIHWHNRPDRPWSFHENELRLYFSYMTFIDAQIGRFLDWLKASGHLENTVIVFASDHGDSLGAHAGLVNKSMCLYEESVRIPLMIHIPGSEPSCCRSLCNLVDLHATLLDLAGLPPGISRGRGRSLLPWVRGESVPGWKDEVVVESSGLGPVCYTSRMIRCEDMKYVFNCGDTDELYDLSVDPHEMNNIVNSVEYSPALEELQDRLHAWLSEQGDPLQHFFRALLRGKPAPSQQKVWLPDQLPTHQTGANALV